MLIRLDSQDFARGIELVLNNVRHRGDFSLLIKTYSLYS